MAGRAQTGRGSRAAIAVHAVQRRQEHRREGSHEHRQQAIERKVTGNEGVAGRVSEQRRFAEDGNDHRVGDDAGKNGRDQRFGLEVVPVKHLDGEEGGPEGRTKDGGQTGGDPGDHQDAPFAGRDLEGQAHRRPERGADLHGRPLPTAGPAAAQGEDRGERFHPDDPPADHPTLVMEGVDGGIATASPGLRGQ